jgi:hypothetical protein
MTPLRLLRPFAVPVALLAVALATGGIPGIVAGSLAVLLAIDRMLDRAVTFTGWGVFEAERRYRRAARARRADALLRRVRRLPPPRLEYLAEDTGWAAVAHREHAGVQPIALDSVVGTVERRKADDFDRAFRPPAWSRGRWTLMAHAVAAGARLPPISVYRVGERHYVRDGHHRVSVARALDAGAIEADVTVLTAPRPAGPERRRTLLRPSAG